MATLVSEAIDRLDNANKGFGAFATLVAGGGELLEPEQVYCLLAPLFGEVDAALDELRSLKVKE